MRALLLAAALLAALAPLHPVSADTCNFSNHDARVLPSTNYWLSVHRSSCQTNAGVTYHRDSVLLSEGNPNDPGSVRVAYVLLFTSRQMNADGSGYAYDNLTAQQGSRSAWIDYRGDQDKLGFSTCVANVKLHDPPSTHSFTTNRMNVCPPYDMLLV